MAQSQLLEGPKPGTERLAVVKFTKITDSNSSWVILKIIFSGFLLSLHQIQAPHSQFLDSEYLYLPAPSTTPVYLCFLRGTLWGLHFSLCAVLLPPLPVQNPWDRLSCGQRAILRVPCSGKSLWGTLYWSKVRATHSWKDYLQLAERVHIQPNPATYQSHLFWAILLLVKKIPFGWQLHH